MGKLEEAVKGLKDEAEVVMTAKEAAEEAAKDGLTAEEVQSLMARVTSKKGIILKALAAIGIALGLGLTFFGGSGGNSTDVDTPTQETTEVQK